MKTETELKQLAQDIVLEKIFTSRHIPSHRVADLLPQIFICLTFLDSDHKKKILADAPHLVYERYEKSIGHVNGWPIFLSCHWLGREEADTVLRMVNTIQAAVHSL